MKRFFTFLMAILALLSISQVVKAADCYIMGSFNATAAWTKLDGQNMTARGGEKYIQEYKCTTSGEYRFRFAVGGESWQLCPHTSRYNLTEANPNYGCAYTTDNGKRDYYFYVNMESGKTYTFTFDNSNASNRNVACKVSGSSSSSTENYAKFYLIGSMNSWKEDNKNYPFTTTDGKTYTCILSGLSGELYFKPKGFSADGTAFGAMLGPDTDTPISTEFQKITYNGGAWTLNASSNKTYTITLDYSDSANPQIKYSEGSSEVVTKVIKFLNGETEITGSNGKYTLDLSSATTDATIKLTIDGVTYGLATAQTISAAGTTSGIAFIAEGPEALTLKAGLIYSLSVTDDGKMTVVAKDNPYVEAGAGFYLVGDFMSQYNDKTVNPGGDTPGQINYERLYFKFEEQKDGSYQIVIPACLTAKMQILGVSVDGVPRVYGPKGIEKLHGAKNYGKAIPATDGSVGGDSETNNLVVVEGFDDKNNYWDLFTRNDGVTDDDGAYEVSFKYNPDTESPTTWTIKHNSCKRVMYLLSNAKGSTAQPLYDSRKSVSDGYSDNASASAIHLEGITNTYFVLGTVVRNIVDAGVANQAGKANDGIHEIPSDKGGRQCGTHDKFFFLGADPVYDSDNTIVTKDSYQLTANKPAVAISKLKGNKIVQVNPTKGRDDESRKDNSYGMQAEIYVPNAGKIDYPDVISMVGPAISSTTTTVGETTKWLWDATAGDMTYDKSDRCYKLVLNTSEDLKNKKFRFVGDHAITQNWFEDDVKANDAYPTTKAGFSDATVADPNKVSYTYDCTETSINHDQDIIWNRGAGLWTVRFYINDDKTFHYTITGASKIYIPVTAHMGKLLRTYTSAIDVVPVNDDVQIFAAQSYTKQDENKTGSGDETGTVKLYRLKYIPANQGVVLFAPNSPVEDKEKTKLELVKAYSATVKRYSHDAYDYIEDWANSDTKREMWYYEENHAGEQWNNYLVPVLEDTKITQFHYDENNEWTGRNFSFTRYSQTNTGRKNNVTEDDTTNEDPSKRDYYSFFRFSGTAKANYSYLMLPLTVMKGNGQILDQNKDNDTKAFAKSMVWFEGIDAPMDNETTGISELKNNASNSDAAYYTLQGVKVAKPVKGIYIHQGKKIMVK